MASRSPNRPLATRAALASVATALFLLALKGHAAWATSSVAMLASLADTALDLVASLVTLWGVRIAAAPADRNHRFGHGKAEAIAALFQVAVISMSAAAIALRAVAALVAGGVAGRPEEGIAVSLAALAATGALLLYQRRVIAATGSVAIGADHIHYQSDLLLNGAVILALALDGALGWRGADALFGLAIAGWLGFGAWRASTAAIHQLMDREWPEEKRRRFLEVAGRQPALAGIHDLRTRSSGSLDFVQFHVWVDPDMTVAEAHRITDAAELCLAEAFPDVEILIHLDPEGQVDREGALPAAIAEEPAR